jgi:CheY-like chemotaxis protein
MKNLALIVEDEITSTKLLENILKNDFEVVSMQNGLDAILWLKDGHIPLFIIADLYMPQMDGFEFIALLKSNHLFSKIPIIIVSAEDLESTKTRCLKAGANKYLTKPVDLAELTTAIHELTGVHH